MKRQQIRKASILISFFLFPVTVFYFSPYLIIIGASEGVLTGSFIVFSLLFITSLLFGRIFCSWICPAAGIQESCTLVNDKRFTNTRSKWVKYVVWCLWITTIIITILKSNGIVGVDTLYKTWHGISMHNPYEWIVYYIVMALIVSLALAGGRRSFCHTICWMAPFMAIGNIARSFLRLPGLRLKTQPDKCINCNQCSRKCPMSLNVVELVKKGTVTEIDCILCGECIDVCPKDVIRYTLEGKSIISDSRPR